MLNPTTRMDDIYFEIVKSSSASKIDLPITRKLYGQEAVNIGRIKNSKDTYAIDKFHSTAICHLSDVEVNRLIIALMASPRGHSLYRFTSRAQIRNRSTGRLARADPYMIYVMFRRESRQR
jgi:hypothetical protein